MFILVYWIDYDTLWVFDSGRRLSVVGRVINQLIYPCKSLYFIHA